MLVYLFIDPGLCLCYTLGWNCHTAVLFRDCFPLTSHTLTEYDDDDDDDFRRRDETLI